MIELVKATVADARLLAETRNIVWKETYRGIYPDDLLDAYDLESHRATDARMIQAPDNHYYLFLDGSDCVGYFSFGPYHYGTYKDFCLCLNHLYIRKPYQGRGLGKKAFTVLQEFCYSQGINRFFCGCNANNGPAIAFYTHMGGIQGDQSRKDAPKQDQIIHFEFYLKEGGPHG